MYVAINPEVICHQHSLGNDLNKSLFFELNKLCFWVALVVLKKISQKFYKISKAVFLGGSLIKRGGQNPLEAVRHGANVLHGPNIDNFKEIYKLLKSLNISYQVNSLKSLVRTIDNFILFPNKKNNYTKLKIIGDKILNKTINEINYEIKNEIKKT